MKFIVTSSDLLKNLQVTGSVINPNNTLPILDNFLFDLKGSEMNVVASDLETTIQAKLSVEADEEKRFCVPSKILMDILKTFPEQPLTFLLNDENNILEIVSEQGNYELAFESAEDYPNFPKVEDAPELKVDANSLSEAISKTIFATGNDELRPVMTGVFFEINGNKANFVATDAHRLVKYTRQDIEAGSSTNFILPKKPLNILKNLLSSTDGEIQVTYNETHSEFTFGNFWISARLIDGKYPNYDAVIPKENPNVLTINRNLLLTALKRVSIFANKSTYQVRLKLEGNTLKLMAENPDFSNKAEERLVGDYNGANMEIGFNSKFLMEMVQNLQSEEVLLEMSEPTRAGIIKPLDGLEEGESVLMLVMPILLNA